MLNVKGEQNSKQRAHTNHLYLPRLSKAEIDLANMVTALSVRDEWHGRKFMNLFPFDEREQIPVVMLFALAGIHMFYIL